MPTIPALARARRHLNARGRRDVTLIITGGLRTESDFVKALALGADGVYVFNYAGLEDGSEKHKCLSQMGDPTTLLGLDKLPMPGDKLYVVADSKKAKEVVEERQRRERVLSSQVRSRSSARGSVPWS